MNTDFRVSVTFCDHPKTLTMIRLAGAVGVLYLLRLWTWAATHRPSGDLSGMTDSDLEKMAFSGPKFIETLRETGFIDGDEMHRKLHDWKTHNAFAAAAKSRSERARKGARKRWSLDAYSNARTMLPASIKHDAPSPSPSPSPSPKQKEKETTPLSSEPGKTAPRRDGVALEIFEFWQWITERPTARFTPERKRLVLKRLEDYEQGRIQRAIVGCISSPYNRGENDRGTVYVDLTLICRDGTHIETYESRVKETEYERAILQYGHERIERQGQVLADRM